MFGRDEGWYDFRVAINAYPTTVRRVTFVHLDEIENEGDLNSVMSGSRTNGSTDWVIYPGDDTVTIPRSGGGDWPSVGAYLATVASPDPLHQLSATGSSLSALLSTFPTTG